MNENCNYYRVKTSYKKAGEEGKIRKTIIEELVWGACYADAEKTAYALAEKYGRGAEIEDSLNIVISKTKISELVFNNVLTEDDDEVNDLVNTYFSEDCDEGSGLYAVKVLFLVIDEKTGKEKGVKTTIHIAAHSNNDASLRIRKHLGEGMTDYVIRDVKFDKAEAVLAPRDVIAKNRQED